MSDTRQEAIALAKEVYEAFMRGVVEAHVLNDRVGALSAQKQKKVDTKRDIDVRPVRLMSISGKGGWSDDPDLRQRYAESTNVTLLDHLLSVVRGAVTFAALDTLAANPELNRDTFRAELRVVAAIAFMHDLDKDLGLTRDTPLPLDPLAERWAAYRLDAFVGPDHALQADQIRSLIELAEPSQAHRSPAANPPPRDVWRLMRYVAFADKLDGAWLKSGIEGVRERLRKDQTLRTQMLEKWEEIDLFDPHHPFLLDELQRYLSAQCERLTQVPPLIEVHQDGRLVMLIPAEQSDAIKQEAVKRLGKKLVGDLFGLSVNVSDVGVPEILDAAPDHEMLAEYFQNVELDQDFAKIFRVKVAFADSWHTERLDDLLADIDLQPRWPKQSGQTISLYREPCDLSESAQERLRNAAHLIVLLNHKEAKGLPTRSRREAELLAALEDTVPDWFCRVKDDRSRGVFTSLWILRRSVEETTISDRVWGEQGLLQRWLEGDEDGAGLSVSVSDTGTAKVEAAMEHFSMLLGGYRVPQPRIGANRCLFTDIPVNKTDTFVRKDQLYGIKKSAFSGRDGRLENIDAVKGEAHVSPVSYIEHRRRSFEHSKAKGHSGGIPTLVSSPSTTGLFAALVLNNERDFASLSVYDLAAEQVTKAVPLNRYEDYRSRYRVARFERMPESLKTAKQNGREIPGQLRLLELLLRAALRVGRSVHVFRGLPVQERAFFAYDAMPRRLADLIGGSRLRLEQIPSALERLETANLILNTPGLGFDVFDLYARPRTRIGAVSLAYDVIRGSEKTEPWNAVLFRCKFEGLIEEKIMSETESPLVTLGRRATRIQRRTARHMSRSDELLGFDLSMNAAINAWKLGLRAPEELHYAVTDALDTNLNRRDKYAGKDHRSPDETPRDAILAFAESFVRDIWFAILAGKPPSQANRRVLSGIYRISFVTAPWVKSEAETQSKNQ